VKRWRGHARIVPAVAPHAAYTVSDAHLVAAHGLARELGAPLLIHLAEDRSELERVRQRSGTSSIALLDRLGVLDERVIAAHVILPRPDEIALLARRGVGVAHCPQSNMKIAAGVAPVPALIAAGVAVGVGTDGAGSNNDLDLWEEIDTAAKLHKVTALDPTALPARQALAMATREGARALDLDREIGSLEVGKRADLIVVRADGLHQRPQNPATSPYSFLVYATKSSDVETVLVDGKVVVRDGRVLTLDEAEVLRKATAWRARIEGATEGRPRRLARQRRRLRARAPRRAVRARHPRPGVRDRGGRRARRGSRVRNAAGVCGPLRHDRTPTPLVAQWVAR